MAKSAQSLGDRRGGFTLLELMAATTLLVIAIMAIGAIVVPISRQREQVEAKNRVLARSKSLLEEIKGKAPEGIFTAYDGTTYEVADVEGTFANNREISISVDKTDPTLIIVTVSGSWTIGGHTETLDLTTEIYSSTGQI